MPKALTLEIDLVPVQVTREVDGWTLPWEVNGYDEDNEAARGGGVFDLSSYGVISVAGKDARDFLHRMSTAHFKAFDGTIAVPGGFLTGRAGVVALGWFLPGRDNTDFHFLIPTIRTESAKTHIETFHFAEALTVKDVSLEYAVFGLWAAPKVLCDAMGLIAGKPLALQNLSAEGMNFQAWQDDSREALVWVRMERAQAASWLEWLRTFGVALLGHRLFEYHRLCAGLAEAGQEASDRDILLEAGAERSVARGKGCYPGQEVIERIFTYGQVNRRLSRVQWKGEPPAQSAPLSLLADGKEAASLVSWDRDPGESFQGVGLAYVKKAHWEDKIPWTGPDGLTAVLKR